MGEGLALLGIGQGFLHGQLHGGNPGKRHDQALLRQLLHELHKALAFVSPQQVGGRNKHIVKEQLRGVLRVHAQLVEIAAAAEALHLIGFDHEQRHALCTLVLVGLADHVRTASKSEPVPGSVMAMAPISSPVARRGSQRFFCSSVPWCRM